ncbi:MAG: hypothetical protein ACYTHM_25545, partial [Planctomycetota bacterium]
MKNPAIVLLSISVLLIPFSLFAEEEAPAILEAGAYVFRVQSGEEKSESPGVLVIKDEAFELSTFDERGVSVTFKGHMKPGKYAAGYCIALRDKVRTFHAYGEIESKKKAQGSFSIFENGEKTKSGNWELTKVEKENLTIQSGEYAFKLITPRMPPGKNEVELPAKIVVSGDAIRIDTRGMAGNAITMLGRIVHGKIF